jgi:hypothetical protein
VEGLCCTLAFMKSLSNKAPALEALLGLSLFSTCKAADVRPLLADADVITFPAGTTIERKGIPARQLIGIVDGYLRGFDANGRPFVLGPGDQVGGRELLDRELHSATYTTSTTATLVVVFGRAFTAVARSLPDVEERARSVRRYAPRAQTLVDVR